MKKSILSFVILISAIAVQAKWVRFAVNVSNTVVAQNDMYMTSTFQNEIGQGGDLTHGFLHMTQDPSDTNIYYYTANIPAFTIFEYYFEKGAAGYESENIPVESQSMNGYRWIYADSTNTDTLKLATVLWSENNSATNEIYYRFKLNAMNEIISANGIHIAGDFSSNDPSKNKMCILDSTNNYYEFQTWLPEGTMQHFKYYNGNSISNSENVPSACAMGGKRMISAVDTAAVVLPVVCFNSCTNICQPANIHNFAKLSNATLSPNPISNQALLTFNDNADLHQVSIIDIYGRAVKRINNISTKTITIYKEELSVGLYHLNILSNQSDYYAIKMIIE